MAGHVSHRLAVFCLLEISFCIKLPIVINTWPLKPVCEEAWDVIKTPNRTAVDAVEAGCRVGESHVFVRSVGGSPDEEGETTLGAMIMDGATHDVGSVAAVRRIKSPVSLARTVLEKTSHSLLVGDLATQFAVEMGFKEEDLHFDGSESTYRDWKNGNCQPNYRMNVEPSPNTSCGPYKVSSYPFIKEGDNVHSVRDKSIEMDKSYHSIGIVVIDSNGNAGCGTSTIGLKQKVPGSVGDSPIVGAGCYVDNDVGGATATGDGDVMMRFLPSFHAVTLMKEGATPSLAAAEAIQNIAKHYPDFSGAVLAINFKGEHGAANHGMPEFSYSIRSADHDRVTVIQASGSAVIHVGSCHFLLLFLLTIAV